MYNGHIVGIIGSYRASTQKLHTSTDENVQMVVVTG